MQNKDAFLVLAKAGLWEQVARISPYGKVDFSVVLHLAQEQSVLGLVTAGLDHVEDVKVPYETRLMFVGCVSEIERRNRVMNQFVAELVGKMHAEGIKAVLVKGQGAAQCYEKPLWRSAGDIDFLLDAENYEKAKAMLSSLADKVEMEDKKKLHQGLKMRGFDIELHGKMPFALSQKADAVIDKVLGESVTEGTCVWRVNETDVLLPKPDNHVFLVFTHFLHHFFIEGVGLRQVCDWCRLLWTNRDTIDKDLLERRLQEAGLMSEWQVFASIAVEYLGMPAEAMPFYTKSRGFSRKAKRAVAWIMKSGSFGHKKDVSYRERYSRKISKMITFFRRMGDYTRFALIFPADSPKFFLGYLVNRVGL